MFLTFEYFLYMTTRSLVVIEESGNAKVPFMNFSIVLSSSKLNFNFSLHFEHLSNVQSTHPLHLLHFKDCNFASSSSGSRHLGQVQSKKKLSFNSFFLTKEKVAMSGK